MSEPSQNTTAQANPSTTSPQLALPPPPPPDADAPLKLDVSTGESVSLYDRLGPTVVNSDGVRLLFPFLATLHRLIFRRSRAMQTLSRISNWAEMTEPERERILRVLGKRNGIRLEGKRAELGVSAE